MRSWFLFRRLDLISVKPGVDSQMPGLALHFFPLLPFSLGFLRLGLSIDQSAWRKVVFLLGDTPLTNTWNFDGATGVDLM